MRAFATICNIWQRPNGVCGENLSMKNAVVFLGLAAVSAAALTGCASDRSSGATATDFGYAIECKKPTEGDRTPLAINVGEVRTATDLCFQPQKIAYEGKQTKIIWGQTAYLGPLKAELGRAADGKPTFEVVGGRSTYQLTLQSGAERIAFNFSAKNLDTTAKLSKDVVDTSTDFSGELVVPPLRGLGYTDSRGRGTDAGYEVAQGPYADSGNQFEKGTEASRSREVGKGDMTLVVTSVNSQTGEVAGTFKSKQSSGLVILPGELEIEGNFIGTFKPKTAAK
jgi:photosystem II oxygen-evolving enhancer protein 1